MRSAHAVLLASAVALWCPTRAYACKCAEPPALTEALRTAAAVFEGRVSKLTPLGSNDVVVELSVVRTWKDADAEHILLRTRQDEAACGFAFLVDESYLIYADEAPSDASLPGLEVLRCGRTKLMTEADADLAELGMGVVPVSARGANDGASAPEVIAVQQAKPAAGGCASCSALGQRCNGSSNEWLCGSMITLWLIAFTLRRARGRGRHRDGESSAQAL